MLSVEFVTSDIVTMKVSQKLSFFLLPQMLPRPMSDPRPPPFLKRKILPQSIANDPVSWHLVPRLLWRPKKLKTYCHSMQTPLSYMCF